MTKIYVATWHHKTPLNQQSFRDYIYGDLKINPAAMTFCIYEFKKMKEGQYKTSCFDSKMKTSNTSFLDIVMWSYNGYLH